MISVYDFYKANMDKYKLKIIAGKSGLKKPALWLYMAEDKSAFDFIRGGELTVTTGMAISDRKDLYEFIQMLIKHKASGLIINTGRYIKENYISNEILDLCNSSDFALFTMPWEIHLSDLMQSFANLHFKSRQRDENMKIILPALCRNADSAYKYKDFLMSQGLMPEEKYVIGLCNIEEDEATELYLPDIVNVYSKGKLIILLKENNWKENAQRIINTIPKVHLGLGSLNTGYENLSKSFTIAERALKIAEYTSSPLFCYEEGGIYSLLMNMDPLSANEFAKKRLAGLKDKELLLTLEVYIECWGSLKAAAERLNCHRNTVLYRMEKIKEATGCNIDNGAELSQLYCAIAALKYANSFEH